MNELVAEQVQVTNPLTLIDKMIERGVGPEQLGKMMDLAERWQANAAKKAWMEAMRDCQAEMPVVVRRAVNSQTKSTYAQLEEVQSIAKPIASKHGFSLSFGEADCAIEGFKRIICDVRHVVGHCEQYHLDLPIDGIGAKGNPIGAMNPVQACVSTLSYGQRTLTCRIFNVTVAGEDRDGQEAEATITEDQIETLSQWLEQAYDAAGLRRFMDWLKKEFGIDSISKIPAKNYQKLFDDVKRLAEKKKGGAK